MAAGAASAYALHAITLQPGQCRTISRTRVCAARVQPRTVTVAPSPVGRTVTGSGQQTLAPFTLAKGAELHWSFTNDSDGLGLSIYYDGGVVSSGNATSVQSYLAAGTYTLTINSAADWTQRVRPLEHVAPGGGITPPPTFPTSPPA